ncbi:hypothetical protein DFH09DRAFT_1148045 [Mycena vulgaris]|nr:hypothetical protein DFH09DRAFT_1148045 [Mycena vulgaris]
MKNFPQELIDYILDDLHEDKSSLVHCSLVCRAWLPATRYHLFSDLVLQREPNKSSALLELLALGPCTFTPYVTDVNLMDHSSDAPEVVEQAWAQRLALLAKLPSVTTLCLERCRAFIGDALLSTLAHLTSLTKLRLYNGTFDSPRQLFDILEVCRGLTSLRCYNINCLPSSEPISYSYTGQIRNLDLGLCPEVLRFFAGDVAASGLICGKLALEDIRLDDIKSISALLRRVGENLDGLSIGFDDNGPERNRVIRNRLARVEDAFCDHVDLRHNTNLRTLCVAHIIRCTYNGAFVFCMRRLPQILRTIVSPYISKITFLLYVDKEKHLRRGFEWAALDESLSAPNLDSVTEITFYIRGEMREDHLTAEAAIRLQMPQCCAKRQMVFLDCW